MHILRYARVCTYYALWKSASILIVSDFLVSAAATLPLDGLRGWDIAHNEG
jgi:hypothetical protein